MSQKIILRVLSNHMYNEKIFVSSWLLFCIEG